MSKFDDVSVGALNAAAKAKAEWEEVAAWRERSIGESPDAYLTWKVGSTLEGYSAVRHEVQKLVDERLDALVQEALDRIELRARRAFSEAMKDG